MELIFIINETAGKGKAVWAQIEQQMTLPYTHYATMHTQHATEIVHMVAKNFRSVCIIAVGGDGTIHEVLQAAVHYKHVVVGAFKAGSGNDFSRAFSTFSNVSELNKWYETQQTSSHDIGVFQQEHFFMNNAGLGFDAYVVDIANRSKLKKYLNRLHLGKLSYVYFLIKCLLTYDTFTVQVNDVTYTNVWFVTISNQPYFGGGMKISPHSKTNDGMLECTVVHHLSRVKLLAVFMTVFWGGHTRFSEVTQRTGEQFTLQMHKPLHCHVDGEAFMNTNEQVHVGVQRQCWQNAQN